MNAKCCPLAAQLLPWGTGLQSLGLALMAGGMLALGAFTAPVVFGQFPKVAAAPVMAIIFRRYDIVLQIALALVLLGEWFRFGSRRIALRGVLPVLRWIILAALTASLIYSTQVVNPQIERMNRAGMHRDFLSQSGQRFEATHRVSESLYKLDLLLVILLILMTPFVTAPTVKNEAGTH